MGITLSELWRRFQNIIVTVPVVATQSKDGKMLVKVEYDKECTSDWLPVAIKNNSFIKVWIPMTVGEQVIVLRPFGSSDGGIVLPSIFNKNNKEPEGASETNIIVEVHDGARFEYDTVSKELKVTAKNIHLACENLVVTGDAQFKANVDISEALDVGGDISNDGSIETAGTVTDTMGDLTNFKTSNKGVRA